MMTTLAAPLGVAVVGDVLVSQALTLYMAPVLYICMERIAQGARALPARIGRGFREREAES